MRTARKATDGGRRGGHEHEPGAVREAVERMLGKTRLTYAEVAARARTRVGSRTTTSSVRSAAAEMRRAGRRVLLRPRSREH